VCSGCSGEYAGDFEDSGEPTDDSGGDQPAWTSGRPEGNAEGLERRGFEPPLHWQEDPQSETSRASSSAPGGEICEIVVSATRIVEIRVITANPEEVFEFSNGKGAGKQEADKHSEAASAKYYQTPAGIAEVAGDRIEGPISCGVAACVVGEFRKWSCWARNAVRKAYSGEFHRS
jgi:hypothetical protein